MKGLEATQGAVVLHHTLRWTITEMEISENWTELQPIFTSNLQGCRKWAYSGLWGNLLWIQPDSDWGGRLCSGCVRRRLVFGWVLLQFVCVGEGVDLQIKKCRLSFLKIWGYLYKTMFLLFCEDWFIGLSWRNPICYQQTQVFICIVIFKALNFYHRVVDGLHDWQSSAEKTYFLAKTTDYKKYF